MSNKINCDICGCKVYERELDFLTSTTGFTICYCINCKHYYTEEELQEKLEELQEETKT